MDFNNFRQALPPKTLAPTRKYTRIKNSEGVTIKRRPVITPDEIMSRMNGVNINNVLQKRQSISRSPTPSPLKKKKKKPSSPSSSSSSDFGKKKKKSKKIVGLTPDEYTIKTSTIPNAGNGAFANNFIPKGTTLGYYKGKRLNSHQYNRLKDQSYVWELSSRGGPIYIDGKNPKLSNWLRFLNDSRDKRENVEPYQYRKNLYYRTTKNVEPGQELFVSYGDSYWD